MKKNNSVGSYYHNFVAKKQRSTILFSKKSLSHWVQSTDILITTESNLRAVDRLDGVKHGDHIEAQDQKSKWKHTSARLSSMMLLL